MNFHLCKTRRGSNPEAVVNCNNAGTGGMSPGSQGGLDRTEACTGPLSIHICPTTGGIFNMDIAPSETVEGLKRAVAKKLGVAQEKIRLLYRDRLLKSGTLKSNQLGEGSRVTLLPHVEAGLVSPHPELTVTQALEGLSESQVNDFLAGKSPLTLAMKLGKHMMFLQLQLSTVVPGPKRQHASKPGPAIPRVHQPKQPTQNTLTVPLPHAAPTSTNRQAQCQGHMPRVPSPSSPHQASIVTPPPSPKSPSQTTHTPYSYPVMNCPVMPSGSTPTTLLTPPSPSAPLAKDVAFEAVNTPPPSPCYLHKPIPTVPRVASSDPGEGHSHCDANPVSTRTTPLSGSTGQGEGASFTPAAQGNNPTPRIPLLDKSTLAAAKRSLSMTLEEFSKKASTERAAEVSQKGAVIDTMQRIGHGVYSGTFSGTLNPALQDPEGKPKKSISTIVHILNDLLGASHVRPEGLRWPSPAPRPLVHQSEEQRNPDHGTVDEQREEDKAIRGKVEHIQMRLEEGKRRRQARRRARSPYARVPHHHQHDGGVRDEDRPTSEAVEAMDTASSSSESEDCERAGCDQRQIPVIREFAPV